MRLMQLFIIFLTFSFIAFSATAPNVSPFSELSEWSAGLDYNSGINVNAPAILKDGEVTTSILKQILFYVKVVINLHIEEAHATAFAEASFSYKSDHLILFGSDSSPPQV